MWSLAAVVLVIVIGIFDPDSIDPGEGAVVFAAFGGLVGTAWLGAVRLRSRP